jgi:hypothetical protein
LTSVFRAGDITCISWAPKAIHMGKLPSLCSMFELSAHLYTFSIPEPYMSLGTKHIPKSSHEVSLLKRSELSLTPPHRDALPLQWGHLGEMMAENAN